MSAVGSLLGTALGDAMGLPYEAMSKRRAARMFGKPDRFRFVLGRGMVSDDTEHSCFVAQALVASGGEPEAFSRELAKRLRWWLLGLPAGIGFATMRAIVKLWLGFGPQRSGVFSAGNGPAMRCAVIGAAVDDLERMRVLVRECTRITHTDPKAEHGALAVALAAYLHARQKHTTGEGYLRRLRPLLADPNAAELVERIQLAVQSVHEGEATETFARMLGLDGGVTGYVYDTVPVCIHAWLANPRDYEEAIAQVIRCGGDADTTAAIVGGIVGAGVGRAGLPPEWLERLLEWPRTVEWMDALGKDVERAVGQKAAQEPPRAFAPAILGRNLVFTMIVLVHVVRRCLPPY